MKTILRLSIALLMVGLVAASGCHKVQPNAPTADPLALYGIGINGHYDKLVGSWTAPYIVYSGADTIGAYWTLQEAIRVAQDHSR
jgi:hypothetical protein